MDKVRLAVVGAGGISEGIHLPALSLIGGAETVAVCDLIRQRAESAAKKFNIKSVYTNYLEMLQNEKLDAVFVLTEPDALFRIAQNCMKQNLDVFIEKPAGITLYQAQTLERTASENNVICQVGFNRRHIPLINRVVSKLKEMTTVNHVSGTFVKHSDAAFYDGCSSAFICDTIHVIDTVRWIAGSEAQTAATVISRYGKSPVDNAWNSVIRFENGVTGVIQANYSTGGRVHTFEIHGDDASAYINISFGGGACEAKILNSGGKNVFSLSSSGIDPASSAEKIDGITLAESAEYHTYYGYKAEDEDFINAVKTRKKPLCDISEGVKSMRLAEMLLESKI